MSTRIVIHGRTHWVSRDWRPAPKAHRALNYDKAGQLVDVAHAIPPDSPISPFRGEIVIDQDDGIAYRLLSKVPESEGWLDALWWISQMGININKLRRLSDLGLVDCAKERCSAVRWVRCRDMPAIIKELGSP
jgi:hypothetical protein